ncbi:hypothetical protein GCM10028793_11540 [Nocardiopsis oceani]
MEGDVVFVEDEHGRVGGGHLTVLFPNLGVGGGATGTGWGAGGLPSTMFGTGYHRVVVSVPRFVPDPGGVCWHGFQKEKGCAGGVR